MITILNDTTVIQHFVHYNRLRDGEYDMDNIQIVQVEGESLVPSFLKCASISFIQIPSCYNVYCDEGKNHGPGEPCDDGIQRGSVQCATYTIVIVNNGNCFGGGGSGGGSSSGGTAGNPFAGGSSSSNDLPLQVLVPVNLVDEVIKDLFCISINRRHDTEPFKSKLDYLNQPSKFSQIQEEGFAEFNVGSVVDLIQDPADPSSIYALISSVVKGNTHLHPDLGLESNTGNLLSTYKIFFTAGYYNIWRFIEC
jgi:hypothetical protein